MAGLSRRGKLQLPISHTDILEELGTYELVKRDPSEPLGTLAKIFYAYANARVTLVSSGVPGEQWGTRLGNPPWDEANRLLRFFETRFQLTSPGDVRFEYELRCHLQENRVTIKPSALSSGEQAVLALVAVMVTTSVLGAREAAAGGQAPTAVEPQVAVAPASGTSGTHGGASESFEDEGDDDGDDEEPAAPVQEPRGESRSELLLLDEPDAHLHTSMVKRYLEHLEQLTKRGVQIIMVTHRPDTIALAPEGSLFEMRRDGDRTSIVKVESNAELIGRLAADTIAVLPGVRVVLVEDEDDRAFHQWAYDRALELKKLPPKPRLVFMPVNARGGGGKEPLKERLASLQDEGLGAVHRGLIDGDNETTPPPQGVVRLARYTLESYLVDPIALYWAVVSSRSIDETVQLSRKGGVDLGHLGTLRVADAGTLQRITDLVLDAMEQSVGLVDRTRRRITLHGDNGPVSLEYRQWIFNATKRDLRAALAVWSTAVLAEDHLNSGPARSGFVPEDLIAAYRRLVKDPS